MAFVDTCIPCHMNSVHAWHDNGTFNKGHDLGDHMPPTQGPAFDDNWHEPERAGDPRFIALLDDIEKLHAAKQADYGRDADPFANVRASEEWGVDPWVGALIRATDKVRRLQTYAVKRSLVNEGVEDSLMDLAVYALIALILFREGNEGSNTGE